MVEFHRLLALLLLLLVGLHGSERVGRRGLLLLLVGGRGDWLLLDESSLLAMVQVLQDYLLIPVGYMPHTQYSF